MNESSKEVVIRPAGFEEAGAIFNLIKTYPEELLPRPVSDIVSNIDRFLVAIQEEEIVGTVSWQILPEIGAPKQPSVEIKSLCVAKSQHKTGLGTKLVNAAVERIRPLHPSQVVVLTFSPHFFATLGFKEIEKEAIMHRLYMGCLNCSKYDSPFTCPEIAMALDIKK